MPLDDGRLLQAFTGVHAARLEAARAGTLQRLGALRGTTRGNSTRRLDQARREGVLRKPLDDGRVLELRIVS